MGVIRVLSMAMESARRARRIELRDEEALSALRWEIYASLQNLLDALTMLVSSLRLRKPSTYAELGTILREHGVLDRAGEDLVKRVARARNLVAHAYRRMEADDLMDITRGLLPPLEDLSRRLIGFVEKWGIDPGVVGIPGELSGLFERKGVLLAYLFGSRARGNAREESDYDFAILFGEEVSVLGEIEVAVEIADVLGVPADKVDVVALDRADLDTAFGVVREGELIYARDDGVRRHFEARVLIEALDIRDLMDIYVARLSAGRD